MSNKNIGKLEKVPAIYEIAISKKIKEKKIVVYLGMTGNVYERMLDHCNGERDYEIGESYSETGERVTEIGVRKSNIRKHTADAKQKNYQLLFRYHETKTREEAGKMEGEILAAFNYAWNIGENSKQKRVVFK